MEAFGLQNIHMYVKPQTNRQPSSGIFLGPVSPSSNVIIAPDRGRSGVQSASLARSQGLRYYKYCVKVPQAVGPYYSCCAAKQDDIRKWNLSKLSFKPCDRPIDAVFRSQPFSPSRAPALPSTSTLRKCRAPLTLTGFFIPLVGRGQITHLRPPQPKPVPSLLSSFFLSFLTSFRASVRSVCLNFLRH